MTIIANTASKLNKGFCRFFYRLLAINDFLIRKLPNNYVKLFLTNDCIMMNLKLQIPFL